MTEKSINPADKPLPAEPEIDRAALILFDGKARERFDFTRAQAEDGNPIDHGPIIGPIIDRTMAAIWPHTTKPDAKREIVAELLNPNVVKLIEGEVYDLMTHRTYRAGEQMAAEVWLRSFDTLPQRTANDAPVGYSEPRKSDDAPKGSTIHITAYDGLRIVGDVAIKPNGDIHDRVAWLESPDDHRKAVYAVLRELHGVTTRSPSEAHALAGATQLDEALSGSTEGISQSILSAAAEAAALEPVSEAGGEDFDLSPEGIMADRFDRLVDYWESQGIPASMEMKLRELLADETPDPAVMSDVLFVLDLGNWQTRAVFTEDGVRLEGNSAHDLLPIIPQVLESAMQYGRQAQADKRRAKAQAERKERGFEDLRAAGQFIRSAIYSGEGDAIDAATDLIEELHRWIDGQEFPHDDAQCQGCGRVEDAPLTSEARDRIKAAIDADIANTNKRLMADIRDSRDAINAKDFDHAAGDAYLRERQDQSALDRIRGEAASATAGIVDRMMAGQITPDDAGGEILLLNHHSEALGQAFARAATMGSAWLHVTHAHAEGIQIKLVTPQDMDPDFADMPITREPQDSDAPDGVEAETVQRPDTAYITAGVLAKRHGVAIIEYQGDDRFTVASPVHYKIGVDRLRGHGNRRRFFAKSRTTPKT